jgi:FkbM family methyltransferase
MRTTTMNTKAIARFFYANVPGVASARFAVKDLLAPHFRKPEYEGVLKLSVGSGLIVDIGANRGQSIAAFKKLEPRSTIAAFEPERKSAERLIARYQDDETVTIHSRALGEQPGTITFFVPSYGRWDCDGMSATDRAEAVEWLRDPGRMYRFNETKLIVNNYPVECRTLDSYNMSPRLIKMHAQGAELAILKGARQTIRQHRPALMCAFPTPEVTGLLAEWGYQPYSYSKGRFTPGMAARSITFTWYLIEDHKNKMSFGT